MRTHVTIVAWLHIISGLLGMLVAAVALLGLLGIGMFVGSGDPHASVPAVGVFGAIGTIVFVIIGILSLPDLLAGIGVLNYAPWGRIVCIITSILGILNFPLGTAIGGYSLWVLFQPETVDLFDQRGY